MVEDCSVRVDSAMQPPAPLLSSFSSADHNADAMDKFISLIERGNCTVHFIRSAQLPSPSALTTLLRRNPRVSKQGWRDQLSTDGKPHLHLQQPPLHLQQPPQHLQQRAVSPFHRLQRAREPGASLKFKSFLSAGVLHINLLRFP
jgi:hypothetical protein